MPGDRPAPRVRLSTIPASLPSSEDVRRNALQASWQRDRLVASRRLLWRWTWWYARKLLLPLLMFAAIALAIWLAWFHKPGTQMTNAAPASSLAKEVPEDQPIKLTPDHRLNRKEP